MNPNKNPLRLSPGLGEGLVSDVSDSAVGAAPAPPSALAVPTCSAYVPPPALWVRFGKERSIIGQWDFEPFPPEMCEEMGIIKYTREVSPNPNDEPHGRNP